MKRLIRFLLKRLFFIRDLREIVKKQGMYPAGHYYSPIPDRDEVVEYVESRKPFSLELPGVTLNHKAQSELLNDYVKFYAELFFPEHQRPEYRYYYDNIWFRHIDAIFLHSFLRDQQPKRIIEVGSGFSSAVMLDTIDSLSSYRPEMTFIEPNPDRLKSLLRSSDESHVRIIDKRIQEVPLELFSSLEAGDLLFIDSSHVMKCGSDVQLLIFEILPILPSGVFVHFHDVFYPFDYPPEWLLEGRYWNENYFLRAFLSSNSDWSIYLFNTYVSFAFKDFLKEKMPLCLNDPGGSLYIRKA